MIEGVGKQTWVSYFVNEVIVIFRFYFFKRVCQFIKICYKIIEMEEVNYIFFRYFKFLDLMKIKEKENWGVFKEEGIQF